MSYDEHNINLVGKTIATNELIKLNSLRQQLKRLTGFMQMMIDNSPDDTETITAITEQITTIKTKINELT